MSEPMTPEEKLAVFRAEAEEAIRLLHELAGPGVGSWRNAARVVAKRLKSYSRVVDAAWGLLEITAATSTLRAYGIDASKLTMANLRLASAIAELEMEPENAGDGR